MILLNPLNMKSHCSLFLRLPESKENVLSSQNSALRRGKKYISKLNGSKRTPGRVSKMRIVGWGNMTGEDKCDCGGIASLIVEVNGEAIPKCSNCVPLDTEDKVREVLMEAFGKSS